MITLFRSFVFFLVLTASGVWSDAARASNRIVALAYLMDAPGQLSVDQVQAASQWTPYEAVLSKGFVSASVWIRIEVAGLTSGATTQLRVRPAFLDEVTLFYPDADAHYASARSGDLVPYDKRDVKDSALAFNWLPQQSNEVLYLRVRSSSAMVVSAQVLDIVDAQERRDLEHAGFGLSLGVMLVLLLWSLWLLWDGGDRVVLCFSLYQTSLLAMSFGMMGFAARYVFPDTNGANLYTSATVLAASFTGALFHRQFLRDNAVPSPMLRLFDVSLITSVTNAVLLATGSSQLPMQINALSVTFFGVIMFPMVWMLKWRNEVFRKNLVRGYAVLSLFILISILPNVGLLRVGEWALYMTMVHGIVTSLVLFILLRERRLVFEKNQTMVREELIQANAIAHAAITEREEKDKFLAMLTHELRTPLSVIRLALSKLSGAHAKPESNTIQFGLRAVRDINNVLERCIRVDQVDSNSLPVSITLIDADALIKEVIVACSDPERVHLESLGRIGSVSTDHVLFKVVLGNLLDNALKYSAKDAQVRLVPRVMVRQGKSVLSVRVYNLPNTAGRPDAAEVFAKYYRSPGAHQKTGSGLGLYLSQSVARSMGGDVTYISDFPLEVCFEFWVPL